MSKLHPSIKKVSKLHPLHFRTFIRRKFNLTYKLFRSFSFTFQAFRIWYSTEKTHSKMFRIIRNFSLPIKWKIKEENGEVSTARIIIFSLDLQLINERLGISFYIWFFRLLENSHPTMHVPLQCAPARIQKIWENNNIYLKLKGFINACFTSSFTSTHDYHWNIKRRRQRQDLPQWLFFGLFHRNS